MQTIEAHKIKAVSVRCTPDAHALVTPFDDIIREFDARGGVPYYRCDNPDTPVSIFYTSGTTGNPKVFHADRS